MALNANQAALPKAITVRASIADMRNRRGPSVAHYNMPLDRGRAFRFVEGSLLVDTNGVAVIGTNGQGTDGKWLLVREPIKGADLADLASQTITVAGDFWRTIPVIGQTSTITLGTTNAEEGDRIEITRTDASAFTLAIINGGTGAGTLVTFPTSLPGSGEFYFNGTDWEKMHASTMLV